MELLPIDEHRSAVEMLMDYAVPAGSLDEALAFLDQYAADRIALNLLHAFYSFLPEAREDWVASLRLLARKQGVYLLLARTGTSPGGFIYLVTPERAEFLGSGSEGIWDKEVLD